MNQSGSQIRALSPELSVDIRFETRSRSTPSLTFNLNLRRGKVDIIFSCLYLFHFRSCSNWMPQNCGCKFKCLVFFIDLLDASVASLLADSVSHQLFVTCSTTSLLQGWCSQLHNSGAVFTPPQRTTYHAAPSYYVTKKPKWTSDFSNKLNSVRLFIFILVDYNCWLYTDGKNICLDLIILRITKTIEILNNSKIQNWITKINRLFSFYKF